MHFSANAIDLIILVFLLPGFIGGLIKGFTKQAAALLALVIGVWVAIYFSEALASLFKLWFKSEGVLIEIVAFGVLFIATLFGINLAGKIIARLLQIALLGWLDKILGLLFGVVKYGLILSIIIFLLTSLDNIYPFIPQEIVKSSLFYPIIKDFAPSLFSYFKNIG
ncbi:MAG: CvpA family protein [Bacteroidales bacterium]